ncbi:hypothetical protein [Noviherbaspirillum pedocola]|uniref:hypothetical protein n=1 Tax=Noviherbaspirillum pedocola TaxID=2801341 RepID=UPI001F42219D|nr:hypothetical protein [Noviherbaspirillum pedocola]
MSRADLIEVIRLGLAAFRNDQDAVIAGATAQLSFQLLALALSGRTHGRQNFRELWVSYAKSQVIL